MAHAEAVGQGPTGDIQVGVGGVYDLDELVVGAVAHTVAIGVAVQTGGRVGQDLVDDPGRWLGRWDDVAVVAGLDLEEAKAIVHGADDGEELIAQDRHVGVVALVVDADVARAIGDGPFAVTQVGIGDGHILDADQDALPLLVRHIHGGQYLRIGQRIAGGEHLEGRGTVDLGHARVLVHRAGDAHPVAQGGGVVVVIDPHTIPGPAAGLCDIVTVVVDTGNDALGGDRLSEEE